MTAFTTLVCSPLPSEAEAAQQKSWVTYTPLLLPTSVSTREPTVKLKESHAVISGAGTTGLRTWEAALHLGSYLCSSENARSSYAKDKHVLELGAGTGFLSILCAKHLGAKHVTATDGDAGVVEALKENLFYNDVERDVSAGVMRWGWTLKGSLVEHQVEEYGDVDTVLGADVTYDKAVIPSLVSTIRHVFETWPRANVLIAATIRNEQTFAPFEHACKRSDFGVIEVDYALPQMREQTCLFRSADVPIRILRISAPLTMKDSSAI